LAGDQNGGGKGLASIGQASEVVVTQLLGGVRQVARGAVHPTTALASSFQQAHGIVVEKNREQGHTHIDTAAASTGIGVLAIGDNLHVGNVGDGRVVLWSAEGEPLRWTEPHNYNHEQWKATGDPYASWEFANGCTSMMGGFDEKGDPLAFRAEISDPPWAWVSGQLLLIGTDGLWDGDFEGQRSARVKGETYSEHNSEIFLRRLKIMITMSSHIKDPKQRAERLAKDTISLVKQQLDLGFAKSDNCTWGWLIKK
jgi:serine/threonine protein phosphatase PrpC